MHKLAQDVTWDCSVRHTRGSNNSALAEPLAPSASRNFCTPSRPHCRRETGCDRSWAHSAGLSRVQTRPGRSPNIGTGTGPALSWPHSGGSHQVPCTGPASRKRRERDEEGREGGLARGLHAPEVSVVRTVSRGREGQEASESARGSRPSLPGRWGHLEAVGAAPPARDPDGLASPSVPLAPGLALSVPQGHCPPTGPAPCPHSVASAHRGPSAVGAEPSGPDLADEQDAAPAAGSQSPGRSRQPPSRRRPPVAKQARNATPAAAECALCVSPERLERSPVCRAERGTMPPPPCSPCSPRGLVGLPPLPL